VRPFVRIASLRVSGVTLLELMITLSIIGILSSVSLHWVGAAKEEVKDQSVVGDLLEIESKLMMFYIQHGRYPDTLAEAGAEMNDPWGNPYHYLNVKPDDKGKVPKGARKDKSLHPVNTDFDLYSAGEDGQTNAPLTAKSSRDDIIRGGNGSYYGLAESF
jgi:general secretion pathway protein G